MINILFNILLWEGLYYAAVYYFPLLFEPQTNYVPKIKLQSFGERYYYYYQLSLIIFTIETFLWSTFVTQYLIFIMSFPLVMNMIIQHPLFQKKYINFCTKWTDKILKWLCQLIAYVLNYISNDTYMLNVEYTYSDIIKHLDQIDQTIVYEWFKSLCYGYVYKYIKQQYKQYITWNGNDSIKVNKTHAQIITSLRNKEITQLLNPNIVLYLVSYKSDQSHDKFYDMFNFEYFNFIHLWSCLAFIQFYFPVYYYKILIGCYVVLSLLGYYQKPLLWYFFKVFIVGCLVENVMVSVLLIRFVPWSIMDIRNKKKLKHILTSLLFNLALFYLPGLSSIQALTNLNETINRIICDYVLSLVFFGLFAYILKQKGIFKLKYFIGVSCITVLNIHNYNVLMGNDTQMSLGQVFLSHILLFYLYKIKPKKTPITQLCTIQNDYFSEPTQEVKTYTNDETPQNNPFSKKDD
jgi:hypothetical protein